MKLADSTERRTSLTEPISPCAGMDGCAISFLATPPGGRPVGNSFIPAVSSFLCAQWLVCRACSALRAVWKTKRLVFIRQAIGNEAGLSCCRTGAPGPWTKETILFLDHSAEPMYIVKAGAGEAVDSLLRNEADWLRTLRGQAPLAGHVPDLIAHRSAAELSFVAESPLPGNLDFNFGEFHIAFLRKFQEFSRQTIRLEDSRLYRNLRSRLKDLGGLLPKNGRSASKKPCGESSSRFPGSPILFVAAHNDFTPWNIRVQSGVVRIFDWEYADYEQLPLFDPLHFALMPMALKRERPETMIRVMRQTQQLCERWLGKEFCHEAPTQALACLVNICMIYLLSVRGESVSSPVFDSYIPIIDQMCLL